MKLAAWQKRWIARTFAPGVRVSALSLARGNGKTALCGWIAAETMRPGSPWFSSRTDAIILASSIQQCRELFGFCRDCIEDRGALGEYTENNNSLRLELTHKRTKARLRAISSSGKGAMGLSRFHLIILDEPASLAPRGGEHLYNALRQSLGKREGQRLILIGTRSGDNPGPWWSSLLDHGDGNGVIVTDIAAPDDAPWTDFKTVKAANPLYARSAPLRAELKAERDEAIRNPTLRPAFEAYRLNRLVDVRSLTLLKTHEWKEVRRRPVPPREGQCIVGIDLGGSVSWSAAWAQWRNGRAEVLALAPGIPELSNVEREDGIPHGFYQRLQDDGVLHVDAGLKVVRPEALLDLVTARGWRPSCVVADFFRSPTLFDAIAGRWPMVNRRALWSESTEDIGAFQRLALDGGLAVAPESQALVTLALAHHTLQADTSGNVRLVKTHGRRSKRDDVIQAGVVAAGQLARTPKAIEGPRIRIVRRGQAA